MRLIMTLTLAALLLLSGAASADPAPFGLEIGKATISDARAKYQLKESGVNEYTKGPMFEVSPTQVDFNGLFSLTLVFDPQHTLVALFAGLNKSRFKSLHATLSAKYLVLEEKIPFVGDAFAEYRDGQTVIMLDAPHLSFEMNMVYMTRDLMRSIQKQDADKAQAKQRSEADQL